MVTIGATNCLVTELFACAHTCMCVCKHAEDRGQHRLSFLIFETGVPSSGLELTDMTRQAGH